MFFFKKKENSSKIKICFLSLGAYPILKGKSSDNIIGPDIHQVILAKGILEKTDAFEIVFIVFSKDRHGVEFTDNIKIIKVNNNYNYSNLSSLCAKTLGILCSFFIANADIYFYHGGIPGIISVLSYLFRKNFIYYVGSDALLDKNLIIRNIRDFDRSRFGFFSIANSIDLSLAKHVIVQNNYQKNTFYKKYKKNCFLIKKPIKLASPQIPIKEDPPILLWVGSIAEVKQPELFIELAKSIQNVRFQMIGGYSNLDYYTKIREKFKNIDNFEYLGVIPFEKIDKYFAKASLLINTSMFEAYPPYTFLQAWMNYTPIVSLNDNSEEILENYNLGLHSRNFNQLVKDINDLLNDRSRFKKITLNGRKFVEKEYSYNSIIEEYIDLLKGIK